MSRTPAAKPSAHDPGPLRRNGASVAAHSPLRTRCQDGTAVGGVPLRVASYLYAAGMPPTLGRPRSPHVEVAVRHAVHRLLADRGYGGLSIEQVALAAGVGKATIYRRWASKAEMVFALVLHDETIEPAEDQGSLLGDLRALAGRILALLSAPSARRALPGLLGDLRDDPLLTEHFQATLIHAERQVVAALLDRAVERGELVVRPSTADVHAQLLGTAFAWLFLVGEEPSPDLAERIARRAVASFTR